MNDLIIVGAGGFGREVAWLVERINAVQLTWNLLGFLDDNDALQGEQVDGYSVLGTIEHITLYMDAWLVCGIATARVRKSIIQRLNSYGELKYATLIDPSVAMSERVRIGEGTIICAHSIVTVDIKIGSHVIINPDCTIGHDAILKDFVTMYPSVNVSGTTMIGECVELGTGIQIIQGKTIGDQTIVGAGAVVVKDLPAKCTAVGSPAKPIKYLE